MPQSVTASTAEGFTQLELKLLTLALDKAAQPGEIRNSALKLIESLRRRGLRPESLILGSQLQPALHPNSALAIARRRGRTTAMIRSVYVQN